MTRDLWRAMMAPLARPLHVANLCWAFANISRADELGDPTGRTTVVFGFPTDVLGSLFCLLLLLVALESYGELYQCFSTI